MQPFPVFVTLSHSACGRQFRHYKSTQSYKWATGLTCVCVGQHQRLEDIRKRDDASHNFLFIHHNQPVHLRKEQERWPRCFHHHLRTHNCRTNHIWGSNTLATALFLASNLMRTFHISQIELPFPAMLTLCAEFKSSTINEEKASPRPPLVCWWWSPRYRLCCTSTPLQSTESDAARLWWLSHPDCCTSSQPPGSE